MTKHRKKPDLTNPKTSDNELDEAAVPASQDVTRVRSWWARYAPRRFRNLLEAKAGDGN